MNIAQFLQGTSQFDKCKGLLKKALAMSTQNITISAILHNLAVISYYEIQYHNNKILTGTGIWLCVNYR